VITENTAALPAGWTFSSAACTVNGNPIGGPSGTGVQFTPQAGQNITCKFNNVRQTGSIIVKKVTIGGAGTFDFSITAPASPTSFSLTNGGQQTFSNLLVGPYTITEVNLPSGWIL
jgi:hypothetical protein